MINCEAPVATLLHRAVAAALDASMVLIAYGLFLLHTDCWVDSSSGTRPI